ncbi:hypothetical protein [Bradyrhizobium sp.]|uniref:hypothetical protein n=1 Tax=Bradyrhizobium sp. TaxID=376 RepID=UPI003D1210FE
MKKLATITLLLAASALMLAVPVMLAVPALAQIPPAVKEPVCEPTGRTSKGDLVYSMECRNIPGLPAGAKPAGYNPTPDVKEIAAPPAAPSPSPPESK